jgi:hypothetical protein
MMQLSSMRSRPSLDSPGSAARFERALIRGLLECRLRQPARLERESEGRCPTPARNIAFTKVAACRLGIAPSMRSPGGESDRCFQ